MITKSSCALAATKRARDEDNSDDNSDDNNDDSSDDNGDDMAGTDPDRNLTYQFARAGYMRRLRRHRHVTYHCGDVRQAPIEPGTRWLWLPWVSRPRWKL